MSTAEAPRPVLASYLVPLAIAIAVLLSMQARFMGDTVDYVNNSFEFDYQSWDFGHLVWVPIRTLAMTLGREGVLWTFSSSMPSPASRVSCCSARRWASSASERGRRR